MKISEVEDVVFRRFVLANAVFGLLFVVMLVPVWVMVVFLCSHVYAYLPFWVSVLLSVVFMFAVVAVFVRLTGFRRRMLGLFGLRAEPLTEPERLSWRGRLLWDTSESYSLNTPAWRELGIIAALLCLLVIVVWGISYISGSVWYLRDQGRMKEYAKKGVPSSYAELYSKPAREFDGPDAFSAIKGINVSGDVLVARQMAGSAPDSEKIKKFIYPLWEKYGKTIDAQIVPLVEKDAFRDFVDYRALDKSDDRLTSIVSVSSMMQLLGWKAQLDADAGRYDSAWKYAGYGVRLGARLTESRLITPEMLGLMRVRIGAEFCSGLLARNPQQVMPEWIKKDMEVLLSSDVIHTGVLNDSIEMLKYVNTPLPKEHMPGTGLGSKYLVRITYYWGLSYTYEMSSLLHGNWCDVKDKIVALQERYKKILTRQMSMFYIGIPDYYKLYSMDELPMRAWIKMALIQNELNRYRKAKGHFPDSISELALPGELVKNPFTGKDIEYSRDGKGYSLKFASVITDMQKEQDLIVSSKG